MCVHVVDKKGALAFGVVSPLDVGLLPNRVLVVSLFFPPVAVVLLRTHLLCDDWVTTGICGVEEEERRWWRGRGGRKGGGGYCWLV